MKQSNIQISECSTDYVSHYWGRQEGFYMTCVQCLLEFIMCYLKCFERLVHSPINTEDI